MKKLILSAAIVLGSLTTISAQETPAQDQNAAPTEQTTPATDQATPPSDQAAPATEQATQTTGAYNEIKSEEVPAAVTESLKKAYPDAELTKAYVNDKKEYKLEVKLGDKEGALYADETGKWIQK